MSRICAFLLLLLPLTPAPAKASWSCRLPCDAPADVALLGTVVGEVGREGDGDYERRIFEIRPVEVFKGTVGKRTLAVESYRLHGDSGYEDSPPGLEPGKRYLFVGDYDERARLKTHICRTVEEKQATDALKFYRSRVGPKGMIYGSVELLRPMLHKSVDFTAIRVVAQRNGRSFRATVRSDGTYAIIGVPSGEYVMSLELPNTLFDFESLWERRPTRVTAWACEEFRTKLTNNGRISGRLVPTRPGARVSRVPVTARQTEEAGFAQYDVTTLTDDDGNFVLRGLERSKFIVGVSVLFPPNKRAPFRRMLYPGTRNLAEAKVFEIPGPVDVIGGDLPFEGEAEKVSLILKVLWPNSQPARGAKALLRAPDYSGGFGYDFPLTDEKGETRIELYRGEKWDVGAVFHLPFRNLRELMATTLRSERTPVNGDEPPHSLIVILKEIDEKRAFADSTFANVSLTTVDLAGRSQPQFRLLVRAVDEETSTIVETDRQGNAQVKVRTGIYYLVAADDGGCRAGETLLMAWGDELKWLPLETLKPDAVNLLPDQVRKDTPLTVLAAGNCDAV